MSAQCYAAVRAGEILAIGKSEQEAMDNGFRAYELDDDCGFLTDSPNAPFTLVKCDDDAYRFLDIYGIELGDLEIKIDATGVYMANTGTRRSVDLMQTWLDRADPKSWAAGYARGWLGDKTLRQEASYEADEGFWRGVSDRNSVQS